MENVITGRFIHAALIVIFGMYMADVCVQMELNVFQC